MHEYAHYLTYLLAKEEVRVRVEEADLVRSARPPRGRSRRSLRRSAAHELARTPVT